MKKVNALSNKASLGTYLTLALSAGALGGHDAKASIITSDLNETSVSMYNSAIGFSYSGGVIGVNSNTGDIYGLSGYMPGKGMQSSKLRGNQNGDDPMNALISSGPLSLGTTIDANTSWTTSVNPGQGLSNAYYGVRFFASPGNYNYAWLKVSTPGTSVIFSTAAVETTANTSIGAGATGAVPEPSTYALLALAGGAAAVSLLRKKRAA